MINPQLHREPTALDSRRHRDTTVRLPVTDWSVASRLNAVFVAAAEFADTGRELPIVFVRAGTEDDGGDAIAPIAVLGLTNETNLCLDGARWLGRYVPTLLRLYPFAIARVDDTRYAVCVDMAYAGVGAADGQRLFDADGQPTETMTAVQKQLESFEAEIQRTRAVGRRLRDLGVLREMRFDATLADGRRHSVDGFLTVDDQKMTALADDVVVELHRNGVLGLVHLHWASLGNMGRLVERHVQRPPAPAAAAAANDASTAA